MNNSFVIHQMQRKDGPRIEAAVARLATEAEWPKWFARNIILWRRMRGLVWDVFGVAGESVS